MTFFFYAFQHEQADQNTSPYHVNIDAKYKTVLWSPKLAKPTPPGMPLFPFGVWWIFHWLQIFANQDYRILVVYDGATLIHRSCIFPWYFRFPFMAKDDLQIGDTWTHPDYRGQGLATFAIQKITGALQKPGRIFWYVVEQDNIASIRVVEKAGFELVGKGVRTKRFGIGVLGAFVIQSTTSSHK